MKPNIPKLLLSILILLISITAKSQSTSELITNGDFSSTNSWSFSGDCYDFTYNASTGQFGNYHSASSYAAGPVTNNGNKYNSSDGSFSQNVSIPSNTNSGTLYFYYYITTDETTTTTPYDYLYISFSDGTYTNSFYLSNLNASSGYNYCSIPSSNIANFSNFIGNNITVKFEAKNDGAKATVFRVDDVSFKVQTSSSNCSYTLSSNSQNFSSSTANDNFYVSTQSGCNWTASTNDSWISFSSNSGSGSGYVYYTVAQNTSSSSRTGYIKVGGQTFTVTQNAASSSGCSGWSCNPTTYNYTSSGGNGSFNLSQTTGSGCQYSVTPSNSWINNTYFSGNTVYYTVDANTGAVRSGYIYIYDISNNYVAKFTVTQAAYSSSSSCTGWYCTPTTYNYSTKGGSGSFNLNVTSGNGCQYSVSSNDSWIFNLNPSGGTITYDVDMNSGSSRSGTISIYDASNSSLVATFTVKQDGVGCSYSLSSTGITISTSNSYSGDFDVNTQNSCSWSAQPDQNWIHTSSSGTNSGKVYFSIDANTLTSGRSGNITVQGNSFSIYQPGGSSSSNLPDLTLTNIAVSQNPVNQGSSTTVTCDYKNIGNGDAQNIVVSYWLSDNTGGNTSNDYFLGISNSFDLYSGATNSTTSFKAYIPVDKTWSGTKYLKCWIDASDNITETNENNNLLYTQLTIKDASGQYFELNTTPSNDPSIISHLRWPFGRGSNWNYRTGFYGGSEPQTGSSGPSGHGEGGHNIGEFYADDWINQISSICGDSFFAPLGGNIIYLNNTCTNGCSTSNTTCGDGYGNNIIIQSKIDPNFAFRVAHLKKISQDIIDKYNNNKSVQVGELIGNIGSTGNSTGPHAHCVLYQNIYQKDYISGTKQQALSRLSSGLSAGISDVGPYAPNIFAGNFKFDAEIGGFIGNGGGINGIQYISSQKPQSIELFPNPNNGEFTIQCKIKNSQKTRLLILNMLGEEIYNDIYEMQEGFNSKNIVLNNLPSGIYLITLNTNEGDITKRFVISYY